MHFLTQSARYVQSIRDSIKYPLSIMILAPLSDMYAGASLTWHIVCDYIASLAILPITIILCNSIPPYVAENYTLFTNPGIRRIAKMCIFTIVATGCMLLVYLVLPGVFYKHNIGQAPDEVERVARLMGEVMRSIKFLP